MLYWLKETIFLSFYKVNEIDFIKIQCWIDNSWRDKIQVNIYVSVYRKKKD